MHNFDYNSQYFNKTIPLAPLKAELEARLPWLFQPAFALGDFTGYNGSFGVRSGPCKGSLFAITHEVAHAIEITLLPARQWRRRLRMRDFNMRVRGIVVVGNQHIFEAQTMEATMREIRTGAIQYWLLKSAGYDVTHFVNYTVSLMRHMADCDHGEGSCPINVPKSGYTPAQAHWIAARTALLNEAIAAADLTDIQARWGKVMSWLQVVFAKQIQAGSPLMLH